MWGEEIQRQVSEWVILCHLNMLTNHRAQQSTLMLSTRTVQNLQRRQHPRVQPVSRAARRPRRMTICPWNFLLVQVEKLSRMPWAQYYRSALGSILEVVPQSRNLANQISSVLQRRLRRSKALQRQRQHRRRTMRWPHWTLATPH